MKSSVGASGGGFGEEMIANVRMAVINTTCGDGGRVDSVGVKGRRPGTSLMRVMKRPPKRHGLWRLHCRELTVICCDCCTATATTCTASYISAASVCKTEEGGGTAHSVRRLYNTCQYICPRDLLIGPFVHLPRGKARNSWRRWSLG